MSIDLILLKVNSHCRYVFTTSFLLNNNFNLLISKTSIPIYREQSLAVGHSRF